MKAERFLTKDSAGTGTQPQGIQVADAELQKQSALRNIELLRGEFCKHEQELMAKYGEDAVINVQTGEVTKK